MDKMSSVVMSINKTDLQFVKKIGHGGFGTVNHVKWKSKSGSIDVAAKRLFELDKQELEVLSTLSHPNIVELIGVVDDEFDFMLILELCEEGSLRTYLSKDKDIPLPADQFDAWSKQAAKAIGYLQKMGVIHKDIKSDNFLITKDHVLKLADFGLARKADATLSKASERGTAAYMAPELFTESMLSPTFDIFAFGVVIWEMTTKQIPFEGKEYHWIVYHVCHDKMRLPIPSKCPDHLADLMRRCWLEDRYQRPSIKEILSILSKSKEAKPNTSSTPPVPLHIRAPVQLDLQTSKTEGHHLPRSGDPFPEPKRGRHADHKEPEELEQSRKPRHPTEYSTNHTALPSTSSALPVSELLDLQTSTKTKGRHLPGSRDASPDPKRARPADGKNQEDLQQSEKHLQPTDSHGSEIGTWLPGGIKYGQPKGSKDGKCDGVNGVAVCPNGDVVLSSCGFQPSFKVYNSRNGKFKVSMDTREHLKPGVTSCPREAVVSSDGTTFFVTDRTEYVKVFAVYGKFKHLFTTKSKESSTLIGLAMDSKGHLLVGDITNRIISKHKQDGTQMSSFEVSISPTHLAVTPQDEIIIGEQCDQSSALIVDQNGHLIHTLTPNIKSSWYIHGICIGIDKLFVLIIAGSVKWILCYSLTEDYRYLGYIDITKEVSFPDGIAITKDGSKILVADTAANVAVELCRK